MNTDICSDLPFFSNSGQGCEHDGSYWYNYFWVVNNSFST